MVYYEPSILLFLAGLSELSIVDQMEEDGEVVDDLGEEVLVVVGVDLEGVDLEGVVQVESGKT